MRREELIGRINDHLKQTLVSDLEQSGEAPLLFLDDALSELDQERQGALLRMLVSLPQAFLTSAASAEILHGEEGRRLYVRAGQIREADSTG